MMRTVATAAAMILGLGALPAWGAKVSDVRASVHNLSAAAAGSPTRTGTVPARTVQATSESQVCVFCHTPHGATAAAAPLWNRKLSTATYTVYTSSSLDANVIQGTLDQPGGSSKLCLSCHDGTLAIGSVNVLNGQGSQTTPGTQSIAMGGTAAGGVIASGSGTNTGFTRNLGVNLTNDHPISVSYTAALATRDGELRVPDGSQRIGTTMGPRTSGFKPTLPLEATGAGGVGQMQCAACHDAHLIETDATKGNQKFLRAERFQNAQPVGGAFNTANDIICVGCHDKNGTAGTWAYSAHANSNVATQTYTASAASQRQFPANLPVWKAACLNCHDTHTVQGATRLLREGTDSVTTPKQGGNAASEQTCYQCHSSDAGTVVTPLATVPNIKSDFALARKMPITATDQPAAGETHDIGGNFNDVPYIDCTGAANSCGADGIERQSKLGLGNLSNRHVECTDCHSPHRVLKKKQGVPGNVAALAATPDASGTHTHTDTSGYTHDNLISGVLRGAWGVEPIYGDNSFQTLPTGYTVKRGDPGNDVCTNPTTCTPNSKTYVTREYQICFKCHSDYGYSDNNLSVQVGGNRPLLSSSGGGTPSGTNLLTMFTNQAREFQAPVTHRGGESGTGINQGTNGGAHSTYNTNNHRSWHPVMDVTGRNTWSGWPSTVTNMYKLPWSNAVGTQTMYCTDCHGSSTTNNNGQGAGITVIPNGGENGSPWGPHGSTNNFILKGEWSANTGVVSGTPTANGLCFKCHDAARHAQNGDNDVHQKHYWKMGGKIRCSWCHVAVPHGWKNKALLVNLNDVGPEVGLAAGTQVGVPYNREPYYMNALLYVRNFRSSGNWSKSDCGRRSDGQHEVCGNPP